MKYLTPAVKILPIGMASPIALSFGGGTESTDANYIVNVIYDDEDEDW